MSPTSRHCAHSVRAQDVTQIYAHLVLPTRKAQIKNQKSLNFANARQKQSINIVKKLKDNK
jgi:hypothetical protein